MKSVLGITIIAILALLGSRWTFTRVRLPLGARHIFFTGTEYILVGVCLGPLLLGLMDEPTLHGLQPLLDLSLGWIGLMFGAQLDHRQVARFPRPYLLATLTQGLITWATCLLPFIFLGGWIPTLSAGPFVVALAIASTMPVRARTSASPSAATAAPCSARRADAGASIPWTAREPASPRLSRVRRASGRTSAARR